MDNLQKEKTPNTKTHNTKNASITAYIGIGANLDNPINQVRKAIVSIDAQSQIQVTQQSSLYQSTPMGPQNQPDFINAVIAIKTSLTPLALLEQMQTIENKQGRIRKAERWGPRVVDLDILLYADQEITMPRLIIPHYGIFERNFVLLPLAEIAKDLIFPDGKPIAYYLKQIDKQGIQKL